MKPIYLLLPLFSILSLSCGSEETTSKENNTEKSTPSPSESTGSAANTPAAETDLSTLEGTVKAQIAFLDQLNKKLISFRSAADAEKAKDELAAFVKTSEKLKKAREQFPELANEQKLRSTKELPMMSLAMTRQRVNFTVSAKKKNVEGVYPIIESYLEQIFKNTPNPHGFIEEAK